MAIALARADPVSGGPGDPDALAGLPGGPWRPCPVPALPAQLLSYSAAPTQILMTPHGLTDTEFQARSQVNRTYIPSSPIARLRLR